MGYRDGRVLVGVFRSDPEKLGDLGRIHRFLHHVVSEIRMRSLGTHLYDVPIAIRRFGEDPLGDEGGITALVVLSTSHIALHTWPTEGGARISIDSCRDYDPAIILTLLVKHFDATDLKLKDISDFLPPAGSLPG
jgi:S-adenosylmethionine/arginine decarboxylase-like enzyme